MSPRKQASEPTAAMLAGEREAVQVRIRELSAELQKVEADREEAGRARGAALADGDEDALQESRTAVRELTERNEELVSAIRMLHTRERDLEPRHALAAFHENDPLAASRLRELGEAVSRFLADYSRTWNEYMAAVRARVAPPRGTHDDATELGRARKELGPMLPVLDQLNELVRWLEAPTPEDVTDHNAPAPMAVEADLTPAFDSTFGTDGPEKRG